MKRIVVYLGSGCVIAGAVVWLVVGLAAGSASATPKAKAVVPRVGKVTSASVNDPLQTVTPYQLQWMHLELAPAPTSVPVSAQEADDAVAAAGIPDGGGPILETVLATCSMTSQPVTAPLAWANRPCWVVVVKPGVPQPPAPPVGATVIPPPQLLTVEYMLVDANTGQVFDAAASAAPASAGS